MGKYPSGARCSTCEGKGSVLTLIGVEIRQMIDEIVEARYGKSTLASTAQLPASDKAEATKANPAPIKANGSATPNLSRAALDIPAGTQNVRSVQSTKPGRSPQKGTWEIP
jgi:hypothetical protein